MNPLLSNGPRLPEAVLDALVGIVEGKREGWYRIYYGDVKKMRQLLRSADIGVAHARSRTLITPLVAAAIRPLIKPAQHVLIGCVRRTQGLGQCAQHGFEVAA